MRTQGGVRCDLKKNGDCVEIFFENSFKLFFSLILIIKIINPFFIKY